MSMMAFPRLPGQVAAAKRCALLPLRKSRVITRRLKGTGTEDVYDGIPR
jgi:hypothetical protein